MASRILQRLGGGMARSARGCGLLLPAGHQVRAPLPAGALGAGTIFSALQSRYASGMAKPTLKELAARIQALEQAGVLCDQRLELLESRAEAAERRAEAAERRAEAAEMRAEFAEKRSNMAEMHVEILGRYAQARESRTERLEYNMFLASNRINKVEQDCYKNFYVMLHLHWILASEVARQRESISDLKNDYRNAVMDAKNAVSATSWRIILALLSGFGAITAFYLPYVVGNTKQEILDEVQKMIKEKLGSVLEELQKINAKPRKWW